MSNNISLIFHREVAYVSCKEAMAWTMVSPACPTQAGWYHGFLAFPADYELPKGVSAASAARLFEKPLPPRTSSVVDPLLLRYEAEEHLDVSSPVSISIRKASFRVEDTSYGLLVDPSSIDEEEVGRVVTSLSDPNPTVRFISRNEDVLKCRYKLYIQDEGEFTTTGL